MFDRRTESAFFDLAAKNNYRELSANQFLQAAASGDITVVKLYIFQRTDGNDFKNFPEVLNVMDERRCTALHLAAANNKVDIIEVLLQAKVDVNARNINGESALHIAATRGFTEVVVALLADPRLEIDSADAAAITAALVEESNLNRRGLR